MMRNRRASSKLLPMISNAAWKILQATNRVIPENRSIHPKWAPAPLLKSYQKTKPPLGFPRRTDSLCPRCVKEVRTAIVKGARDLSALVGTHPGEIKADLVEEDGRILIRKTCDKHGQFEDVLSTLPAFTRRMESLFSGRDFRIQEDTKIHAHGTSSIKYGRGAVLTVDLTNRCNMMCNPCFMDANQVGYVHEPAFEEIQAILDRGMSFKPRRQAIVLLSGGEPTLSPHFLDACRYAKKVGYGKVLAATNGIRFAQSPEFAMQAAAAGMNVAYLQFDGPSNESNSHRAVANLFDVKQRAIENIDKAGMKTTLVVTIVNEVNNDMVGEIVKFAMRNLGKVTTIAFQPVSFTGRDEDISDEDRKRHRYTLSQLALDLKKQLGGGLEPLRDWFPLDALGAASRVMDMLQGPEANMGWGACSCHPNCGIFTLLTVNRRTGEWAPVFRFFDYAGFLKDISQITDSARGKPLTKAQLALSVLRHFDADEAPKGFEITQLRELFTPRNTAIESDSLLVSKGTDQQGDDWIRITVEGMWFQDLFTYDFRRTEMCIIPYGTQEGEISFCAYNTGVGWRQVIEQMHKTASVKDWFKQHGRHPVYAGNTKVPLGPMPLQVRRARHPVRSSKAEPREAVGAPGR
ncbi:MAG: radical SAM protein [Acidobacteriota bacterium]